MAFLLESIYMSETSIENSQKKMTQTNTEKASTTKNPDQGMPSEVKGGTINMTNADTYECALNKVFRDMEEPLAKLDGKENVTSLTVHRTFNVLCT